jgi:hypothetical protein
MQRHLLGFAPTILLLGAALLFSGCLKTEILSDAPASRDTAELAWAHGFVYGLVPPVNAPLETADDCSNGISEVYFRQSFVQLVAQGLTASIYAPQTFSATCAAGGAMSSDVTPPAYLLRGATAAPPPRAPSTAAHTPPTQAP